MFDLNFKCAGFLATFLATFILSTHGQQLCLARVSTCSSNGACPVEDSEFSMPLTGNLEVAQYAPGEYGVLYPCLFASVYNITVRAPGCTDATIRPQASLSPIYLSCNRGCSSRTAFALAISSSCQKNLTGLGITIGPDTQNVAFTNTGSNLFLESRNLPANVTLYHPDHATLDLTLTPSTSAVVLQCKVDGGWGAWVDGSCSKTCGNGSLVRTRPCNLPTPANDGLPCVGDSTETATCNTDTCPAWAAWVDGPCSETCGAGTLTKTRECNQPAPATCDGNSTLTVACITALCLGDWLEWADCSCGILEGTSPTRKRTRPCNNPDPTLNAPPCSPNDLFETQICTLPQNCVSCTTGYCNGSTYQLLPPKRVLTHVVECTILGGKLVEIECQEELTIIENMIENEGDPGDKTNLGLVLLNGQIVYLSNYQPITFNGTWNGSSEPTLDDDCFEIRNRDRNYEWRSDDCGDKEQGICEFS